MSKDYIGRTLLHFARECGHIKCAKYLLQHPHVNAHSEDNDGQVPPILPPEVFEQDTSLLSQGWQYTRTTTRN